MRPLFALLVAASLASCASTPRPRLAPIGDASHPDALRTREAFLHAWRGYRAHAWGHDDLNPVSRSAHDWYGTSVLMTPVDAYDTMLMMGLTTEAAEAKQLIVSRLSFDVDASVQVFEVTIRLLGGLLTAYQMDGDTAFLRLARDVGTRMLPAFQSPTGMPWRYVHLRTGAVRDAVSNPAEIGTLMLEFGTLSKLTGDQRFYDAAKRAAMELHRRRSAIGLVGTTIDVRTGEWVDKRSHVSARIDSWYEYLLKAWLLFGDDDFRRMWEENRDAMNRYVAHEHAGRLWYAHVDMHSGARVATRFGALDAFLPGVLLLGGDTARAARLMESVDHMWQRFDVEPEEFDYTRDSITSPSYQLRPEALESAWYLWNATGDERYRAMGRRMLDALERWCRTDAGYAVLRDVRTKERQDRMHSFLFAETLKYAWLLYQPRGALDPRVAVFNTEAHPILRTW